MSGKPALWNLVVFYARSTWSGRLLAFFSLMLLLSGFLLWSVPALSPDVSSIFPPVSFSVVDLDDSIFSRKLVEQLSDMSLVEQVYVDSLPDAQARLAANEVLIIIVVPEDFYELSMLSEERPPVIVYLNSRQPVETALFVRFMDNMASSIESVQSSFYSYANNLRPLYSAGEDAAYIRVLDKASVNVIFEVIGRRSVIDVDESAKLNTVHFVISSLVCLLTMQTSLLLLTQIQHERSSGIRERLLLAGVSWWQPVLARQITGMLWLAAGFTPLLVGLFSVFPDASRTSIILAVLLLYWITALLCQAIGYLGRPNDKVLLGAWLGIMALMLVGGCIYPEALLPPLLRAAGQLTPAYWAAQTVYQALNGQIIGNAALLAGILMAAAALAAAAIGWHKAKIAMKPDGRS